MLLRPACHRAVQRHINSPADSIWISDEALNQAFQRFSRGSKACRRHGSYVPGPLESRRRLGKRRMTMTLQSDSNPIPTFDPGLFRGWFGAAEKDRTQWHWEPPKIRTPKADVKEPALFFDLPIPEAPDIIEDTDLHETLYHPIDIQGQQPLSFRVEDVAAFRLELEAQPEIAWSTCNAFIQHIKQSLVLGVLPEETLKHILAAVPDITIHQEGIALSEAQSQCLRLYQAIWAGIASCEIRQPDFLHGKTMKRLFGLICRLPTTAESRELGSRLIHAASNSQLSYLQPDLPKFIIAWLEHHVVHLSSGKENTCTLQVERTLLRAQRMIEGILQLHDRYFLSHDRRQYKMLTSLCREAKGLLYSALDGINKAELATMGLAVPGSLLQLMDIIPRKLVCGVFRNALHQLVLNPTKIEIRKNLAMQEDLLSLAAQTPSILDSQFQALLKITTLQLLPRQFSRLLLDQWISQGHLRKPTATRTTWQLLMDSKVPPDAALFLSLYQHQDAFHRKLQQVVQLYHELGLQSRTYKIVLHLLEAKEEKQPFNNLNIYLPPSLMEAVIESVSTYNAFQAHELYHLYSKQRVGKQTLNIEKCSKFLAALINETAITTKTIWDIVGIDPWSSSPKKAYRVPAYVKMVTWIAIAFAHSNRPAQVRFRQVSLCLKHLKSNGVHLTSDMSRAIVLAGITSCITKGKFVPTDRQNWVWGIVSRAEGNEMARRAQMAVQMWNDEIQEKQIEKQAARDNWNGLKLGPID